MEKYFRRIINYKEENAVEKLADALYRHTESDDLLYFCIGYPKTSGDAVAPIVGSLIKCDKNIKRKTVGDIYNPIVRTNVIKSYVVASSRTDKKIIAIDSCISYYGNIGDIILESCPIYPALGMGENLPGVGDASIKVITTRSASSIHDVDKKMINDMATVISKAIKMVESRKESKYHLMCC